MGEVYDTRLRLYQIWCPPPLRCIQFSSFCSSSTARLPFLRGFARVCPELEDAREEDRRTDVRPAELLLERTMHVVSSLDAGRNGKRRREGGEEEEVDESGTGTSLSFSVL